MLPDVFKIKSLSSVSLIQFTENDLEARWTFNIPTLARKVEGVNAGHLIEVGARPNTGKTSFHASLIAGPGGFAEQGAKCVVLCNEEGRTGGWVDVLAKLTSNKNNWMWGGVYMLTSNQPNS